MKVISGIYKIYFINNPNKVYIGSTKNLRSRYTEHIKHLLENKHDNTLLQIDFILYSILNIRCDILEECNDSATRLKKEKEYIEKYRANIDGYNQTIITTNRNDRCIEKEYKYMISNDVIDIIKNHNINIEFIECRALHDEISLSDKFYKNTKIDDLEKILLNMNSFTYNKLRGTQRETVCIFDYEKRSKILKIKERMDKQKLKPYSIFTLSNKLTTKLTSRIIKNVIVFENCNPFFLEMSKMDKDDIDKYRIQYVLKRILHIKLEEDFILYVPKMYYKSFVNGLNLLKAQCNIDNI